ncbi:hypothetical protein HSRCO_1137 [Halanaeroarchaeum sp. HSR-CO]|uniref:hypothetical protein n=1 Tax=Halanaeroarchaeum sp. HSR-CO TaxID=2866382 RepID=UPI00217D3255|nr:hypothetical protein [Halanaeroarchaeum sp. HSR-CO]UWG47424.1 hypothetical protein HSRCO_1137 [Halanaeroarchaeum sp. HSR-CO]
MQDDDIDSEKVKQLLTRLRPGDDISYKTTQRDEATVRVKSTSIEDGYYRIYLEGPEGGEYLIMREKPEGMGNSPAPEAFWVNPEPNEGNNPYELVTRGSVLSLSIFAEREV